MSRIDVREERVLSADEVKAYATTFSVMNRRVDEMRQGSNGQDVMVDAARVLFDGVDPLSIGTVLIEAKKLRTV